MALVDCNTIVVFGYRTAGRLAYSAALTVFWWEGSNCSIPPPFFCICWEIQSSWLHCGKPGCWAPFQLWYVERNQVEQGDWLDCEMAVRTQWQGCMQSKASLWCHLLLLSAALSLGCCQNVSDASVEQVCLYLYEISHFHDKKMSPLQQEDSSW